MAADTSLSPKRLEREEEGRERGRERRIRD
jgi:hypothetical protein